MYYCIIIPMHGGHGGHGGGGEGVVLTAGGKTPRRQPSLRRCCYEKYNILVLRTEPLSSRIELSS